MARCPNINSPEWKSLIKEVGELKAYDLYIKNGYDIPTDASNISAADIIETNDEEAAYRLKEITETRSRILASLKTKVDIYDGSKKDKYINNLKKLINDFEKVDIERSLFLFLENAEGTMKSLMYRIDEEKDNLHLLRQLDNFAGTYETITQVKKFIDVNYSEKDKLKQRIAGIEASINEFHNKYVEYAKKSLVNRLAAESSIIRNKYKRDFNQEFERNTPRSESGLSEKEYDSRKRKYVLEKLNSINGKILQEEKAYIRQLLTIAPKDISSLTASLVDPRGINDQLIQLSVKLLDEADFKAKEQFIKDREEAGKVWEEFIKGKEGLITDQKKLYKDIIEEVNGKQTSYYVRPLYASYYDSLNDMLDKTRKASSKVEADKIRNEWKEKHLIDPNGGWAGWSNVKAEFRNPQWNNLLKDPAKKKMYDFLVSFNQKSDDMVNSRHRLGYRLPGKTKQTTELLTDRGVKGAAQKKLADTFKLQSDDYMFGELTKEDDIVKVLTDEKGRYLNRITVPFRLDVDIKDQSFDLMGMALTNRFVSLNYKEKKLIQADLEVLKDLLAERKIVRTKGLGNTKMVRVLRDRLGVEEDEHQEILKSGLESESYKLFSSILEDRLYGRTNIDGGSILGLSVDKLANFAISASANNMLIANYLGGGANLLAGKVMNFLGSFNKNHYTKKNLLKAEGKYTSDLHKVLDDIGSFVPKAKTNLLLEKYMDTSLDFSGFANDLTKDSKMKRLLDIKTLHGINSSTEHYVQSTLMYAVLDNIKVTNEKGQYVDRNGNPVDDRDKAMSADEAYSLVEGKLKWTNVHLIPEGFVTYGPDFEFSVSRKIKDIVGDLQGMYDEKNKAQIQRYWYGKLGFFLRKWIVRGTLRRWRGVDTATKDISKLDLHQTFYSETTQETKEGTYVSAIRFLSNLYRHGKLLQLETYSKNWSELTDMEKGNIKSAATELAIMVATVTASTFLAGLAKGADDEDEKDALYNLAYLMRRQYGELLFYTPVNPAEVTRILRTPSATISVLELSTRTIGQLMDDATSSEFERYERGEHKGTSKAWVLTQKLLNPMYKNLIDKDAKESYEYLVNVR